MNTHEQDRHEAIARNQPPFAKLLGVRVVSVSPDEVVLDMPVTENLRNRNGVLHGGAIMALADNAGGTTTFVNLKPGEASTTIESKTNFLRPLAIGDVAQATCTPVHRGRTTMVLQTTISNAAGKVVALITQTQMVMPAETPQGLSGGC